jgi:hypothetical protein
VTAAYHNQINVYFCAILDKIGISWTRFESKKFWHFNHWSAKSALEAYTKKRLKHHIPPMDNLRVNEEIARSFKLRRMGNCLVKYHTRTLKRTYKRKNHFGHHTE